MARSILKVRKIPTRVGEVVPFLSDGVLPDFQGRLNKVSIVDTEEDVTQLGVHNIQGIRSTKDRLLEQNGWLDMH